MKKLLKICKEEHDIWQPSNRTGVGYGTLSETDHGGDGGFLPKEKWLPLNKLEGTMCSGYQLWFVWFFLNKRVKIKRSLQMRVLLLLWLVISIPFIYVPVWNSGEKERHVASGLLAWPWVWPHVQIGANHSSFPGLLLPPSSPTLRQLKKVKDGISSPLKLSAKSRLGKDQSLELKIPRGAVYP